MGSSPRWSWRAAVLASLVLLPTAVLAGCEPRVSLGRSCELSSECDPPYVCAAGRCRVECHEVRDCPFPLECLVVGNASGCRVPQDGMCPRGTIDCAEGLECIEGKCTQPCTDHSECASAQTCDEAGGCERVMFTGPCDLLSGAGCGAAQTCTASGCVDLSTASAMPGELHDPCSGETCRAGLSCVEGRCLRWCQRTFDTALGAYVPGTSCGEGSGCTSNEFTGGPAVPDEQGHCTQPCNPARSGEAAGCPSGMHCGVVFFNDRRVTTACYPATANVACAGDPEGDGCRNRPCWMGYGCNADFDCAPDLSTPSMPGRRCHARCLSDDDCATDERCLLDAAAHVLDQARRPIVAGTCLPTCGIEASSTTTTRGCPSSVSDTTTCDVHNGAAAGRDWAYCMPTCSSDTDCFAGLTCDEAHAICTPRDGYPP
ncbi:MAG: hypothetical protein K1X94_16105 [Sandaracinaceae bacterium]|nr:hypothetical protein [Sandaracinaceae bacterium]